MQKKFNQTINFHCCGCKDENSENSKENGKLVHIGSATGKSEFVNIDSSYCAYIVIFSNPTTLTKYTFTIPYAELEKLSEPTYFGSGLYGTPSSNQSVTIIASATEIGIDEFVVVGNNYATAATIDVYGMK